MFTLDRYGRVPIYLQLIEQVELRVLDGSLSPQDVLPSVRALSASLGVNPNTLQKAYTELERRGICRSVPGSGRFVTQDAKPRIAERRRAQMDALAQRARELALAAIPLTEVLACVEAAYRQAIQAQAHTAPDSDHEEDAP